MIVLLEHDETTYAATHAGLLARLRSHLFGFSLDRALADGACPDSTAVLALRARALVLGEIRRGVGEGLRRVVAVSDESGSERPLRAAMPFRRDRVRSAEPELRALSDRLLGSGPVSAAGVAQARLLLTDGGGALYRSQCGDLRATVRSVLEALDPMREL